MRNIEAIVSQIFTKKSEQRSSSRGYQKLIKSRCIDTWIISRRQADKQFFQLSSEVKLLLKIQKRDIRFNRFHIIYLRESEQFLDGQIVVC